MVPEVTVSSPAMARSVVVLPQPDWPSMTTNSPSSITRLISVQHLHGAEDTSDVLEFDPGHQIELVLFFLFRFGFRRDVRRDEEGDEAQDRDGQPVAVQRFDPGLAEATRPKIISHWAAGS